MQRDTATAEVGQLTAGGIEGATISRGQHRAGVRVRLPDGREARWGIDGSATLEAVVLHDGVLVGFVPPLARSTEFTPARRPKHHHDQGTRRARLRARSIRPRYRYRHCRR